MLRAVEKTAIWTKEKVLAIVELEKMTIDYIRSNEELSNNLLSRVSGRNIPKAVLPSI